MYTIRPIKPEDNPAIEAIVKTVLQEFGCTGSGWASGDPELTRMYETYQAPGCGYWVVENPTSGTILGGGGFSRLKGTAPEERVCEVQKLYFLSDARGHGLGSRLLALILEQAGLAGYRTIYLESIPQMGQAVRLYERMGFQSLSCHMGNTGHQNNCTVFMQRPLSPECCPIDQN